MAISTCIKCGHQPMRFELTEIEPFNSRYKMFAVQCMNCGAVAGVTEYRNTNVSIDALKKSLSEVESTTDRIRRLLQAVAQKGWCGLAVAVRHREPGPSRPGSSDSLRARRHRLAQACRQLRPKVRRDPRDVPLNSSRGDPQRLGDFGRCPVIAESQLRDRACARWEVVHNLLDGLSNRVRLLTTRRECWAF